MKRFNFNLVEIMLAVVILSLGMTSVFVLFPAGLSNHKSAMAENSFSDLAELIISHVRSEVALSSGADVFDYTLGSVSNKNSLKYTYDDDGGWTEVDSSKSLMKKDNSTYLVRHLSGPKDDQYTDFAAIAFVYADEQSKFVDEIVVPEDYANRKKYSAMTKDSTTTLKELNIEKFVKPMVLEITYPADRDYDDREKIYFRFEIYNENFELKKQVTP